VQLEIIHELSEGMKGCSNAFVAVALAGIALTVAASSGLPMEDAPEVRSSSSAMLTTWLATAASMAVLLQQFPRTILVQVLAKLLRAVICMKHITHAVEVPRIKD
jgi:hypothetical protein